MKRAFTLIELLVVIAIIAILAAILFPVFAQAKLAAKKTVAVSNAKQITLATIMYAGDSDDLFPFAVPPNSAGNTWRNGSLLDTPSDWRPGIGGSGYPDRAMLFANSVQPYQKNYDLFSVDGAKENFFGSTEAGELKKPTFNSFVMNGFLQNFSSTAVNDVSTTPLYWNGFGNVKMKGYSIANPQMVCPGDTTVACVFPGAGTYQWYLLDSTTPAYMFNKSTIIGRVDGSAKAKNIGAVADGKTNVNQASPYTSEPWSVYTTTGVPQSMTGCDFTLQGKFMACYFRPDADGRKP